MVPFEVLGSVSVIDSQYEVVGVYTMFIEALGIKVCLPKRFEAHRGTDQTNGMMEATIHIFNHATDSYKQRTAGSANATLHHCGCPAMNFNALPLSSTAYVILPAISANQAEMLKKDKVASERLVATNSITNTL